MTAHFAVCVTRVRSRNGEACGTGFLVDRHHVLTCAHVVNAAHGVPHMTAEPPAGVLRLDLPFAGAEGLEAAVVAWHSPVAYSELGHRPLADIAVLRLVADAPAGVRPAALSRRSPVARRRFRTYGFPVEQGRPAYGETLDEDAGRWVHVAQRRDHGHLIMPGFSGAPVFAEDDATVIGMVVAVETSGSPVAYILPPDLLTRALPTQIGVYSPASDDPYRGLESFGPDDASKFFGREEFVEELERGLSNSPALVVVGPSGSGKSSVVAAGLLPRLATSGWVALRFRPGARPIRSLAGALDSLSPRLADPVEAVERVRRVAEALADDPANLSQWLEVVRAHHPDARLLLVADQFEELFASASHNADGSAPGELERRTFREVLGWIARQPGRPSPIALVSTLRADFLGHVLADEMLGVAFEGGYRMLRSMDGAGLGRAIREPAARLGVEFEDGLDDEILTAVITAGGSALPLMQSALKELWDRRAAGRLTWRAYQEIGGVAGALRARAERVYDALAPDRQRRARLLLLSLVRVARSGRGEDTKRPRIRTELTSELWEMAQELAGPGSRLVVTYADEQGREVVDLAHEALLRHWPRFEGWVEEDRRFRALLDDVAAQHGRWIEAGRPSRERLLGGRDLRETLALRGRILEIRPDLAGFLDASAREAEAFPEWMTGDATVPDLGPGADPAGVTGVWTCDDGGNYYIRNVGRQVWWYGSGRLSDFSFANVAYGRCEDDGNRRFLRLRWADVPVGTANIWGHLLLEVVCAPDDGRAVRMHARESSGQFLGSRWTRMRLWGAGTTADVTVS